MEGMRQTEPLAIIGVGCRFPGARDLPAYERLLFEGRCAIGELPAHRFDQARYYDPTPGAYGKSYCRIGGCVEDTPFDHARLGLPAAAGEGRDRAPLWALEAARDALDHAGFGASDLRGSNTAVVIGHARGSTVAVDLAFATAVEELLEAADEAHLLRGLTAAERRAVRAAAVAAVRERHPRGAEEGTGRVTSAMAGLIAAAFGLTGRHLVVDAACASSFAAMEIASRALRQRRVDLALVGGVSFSQEASVIMFAQSRALSADGSFPFDARANGFVSSDGVGIVVLERLEDALARGHPVQAIVRGIGSSCDGKGKGLWAPRKEGQVLAMERALARAGVDAGDVSLVEAHGTSTALGDATEVAALSEVMGRRLPPGSGIPIGSVKGNVGHCREAAGMAGLIKVLLALRREAIPPSIGYVRPNPDIHWERTPLRLASEALPWPRAEKPRLAAVNSFGIGGLNYQVIVEEPPRPGPAPAREAARVAAPPVAPRSAARDPVAIVGLGCVFPGARGAKELWTRLLDGHRAPGDVPAGRWSPAAYLAPGEARPWRTYAARGGFLENFAPDWRRYRIPPALVEGSDPLQFMLLEAALDALEDARVDLSTADRRRMAVVVGSGFGSDFALALTLALRVPEAADALADALRARGFPAEAIAPARAEIEELLRRRLPRVYEDSSGSFSSSTLASRLAKTLDLQGPAFSVDAACASSLVALEAAVEALRAGDTDLVLCAGGDRSLRVQRFEALSQAGLLSRHGHAPFDQRADGLVPAEGAGVCVLKRLPDALAAGDRVYAVVRDVGSASDGEWKDLHQPSPRGLARAMSRAYAAAGIGTAGVGYVEAHAGGWPEAESAEVDALRETFGARRRPLALGTVKANIGHAQAASGMAGLIKTALSLSHGALPPTPGVERPSPRLGRGLEVVTRLVPWPRTGPRARGAVSAMGLGGISCHAVLEEAPATVAAEPIVVRAASLPALRDALDALASDPAACVPGAAWGAGPVAVGIAGGEGAGERLRQAREGVLTAGARPVLAARGIALVAEPLDGGLCALFPGQGAQYPGMLREVAGAYPRAAAVVDECDRILAGLGEEPLSEVLWGDEPERLAGIRWTQLAVLAGGLAMREVAAAHGLEPDLVCGHSYGEYAALVAAGALPLDEAVRWTLRRVAAIEAEAPGGGMAAVFAPRDRVDGLLDGLPGYAAVANVNSPDEVVVSGELAAIEALVARCAAAGVQGRRIPVPAAFHCALMKGAAARFAAEAGAMRLAAPRLRVLSSIGSRERSRPDELRDGLVEQFTAPVDFVAQIEHAWTAGFRRFVEFGPGRSLSRMVSAILADRPHVAVSLDDRRQPGVNAVARALAALRASERGDGRPLPVRPNRAAASGHAPAEGAPDEAALFEAAEWQALSRQPGWPAFWAATRPSLQVFARHLFAQSGHAPRPAAAESGEAGGSIRFFDATALRAGGAAPPVPERAPAAPAPAAEPPAGGGRAAEVRAYLLEQVIGCTGYPPDLLDLDADMEADLGIDSVKQAQIFGRLREHFDLATDDRLSLRDFPTLRRVEEYVLSRLEAGGAAPVGEVPSRDDAPAGAPPAAASPFDGVPDETVAAPVGASPLPVLRLRGTPFEIGLAHGQAQREAIHDTIDAYMTLLGADGLARPALQAALDDPGDFFDEDALEEVRGLAEGTGLPARHLLAYNLDSALFTEYGPGCTHVGLAAVAHGHPGHRGPLHAVNEDSPLAVRLGQALPRVVQVREPSRGQAHVLFSLAGQVGGLNGAGAAGLVATSCVLLDHSRPGARPGLVHPVLVRRLLQQARTTAEAVAVVREAPRRGAWSILLSHGEESRLRCLEYSGDAVHEAAELERHWTANHAVVAPAGEDVPEHSVHRLERLRELLPADGRPLGMAQIQAALGDRFDRQRGRPVAHRTMNTVCRVDNVMSLVADTAAGRVSVTAHADEGTAPAWHELDLASLLGGAWRGRPPAVEAVDLEAALARTVAPVTRRYVLRTAAEPLPSVAEGAYRPERVWLLGEGPVASALSDALVRRGARVEILPLEDDPERLLARADAAWGRGPLPDVCLLGALARPGEPRAGLAPLEASWAVTRRRLVEGPFRLLQAWTQRLGPEERRTVSAVTAQGGCLGQDHVLAGHPEGGAIAGLFRALRRELPALRLKLLDTEPPERPAAVAEALLRELDAPDGRMEAGLLRGRRRVLRLVPAPVRLDPARLEALATLPYVVLTGGGRGITAEVAVRLARAGVRRFHLLGRTPLPPELDEWSGLDEKGRDRLRQDVLERLRAQGGRVTPVEWDRAFAPVARALEVGDTLRRLAAEGASARYHAVDVADRAALAGVLAAVRAEDGPIEAVVHGAGVERARAFAAQRPEDVAATLDAKADGTLHLAALTAGDPLRCFVAFASAAGRFGGLGQADYSAASELQCRLVGVLAAARPDCRALAICWPAWDEVGMAARGDVAGRLRARGRRLMPVAEGVERLVEELAAAGGEREVTYADGADGLDLDGLLPDETRSAACAGAREAAAQLPLVDLVLDAGPGRLAFECRVDAERDAFLGEHRLDGVPVLPAVVALELLAEGARLAGLGERPCLEDVSVDAAFKVGGGRGRGLTLEATASPGAGFEVRLRADVAGRDGRLMEPDRVFVRGHARADAPASTLDGNGHAVSGRVVRARYGRASGAAALRVAHGPSFQTLREVVVSDADHHRAAIVARSARALRAWRADARWILPAPALDGCLQACGLVARMRLGALALPSRFGRVQAGRAARDGEECRALIRLRGRRGDHVHFDFTLVGDDGAPLLRVDDYAARVFAAIGAPATARPRSAVQRERV